MPRAAGFRRTPRWPPAGAPTPFPASFRRVDGPSSGPAPPLCATDLRLIYQPRYCSPLHYLERRGEGSRPLVRPTAAARRHLHPKKFPAGAFIMAPGGSEDRPVTGRFIVLFLLACGD